METIKIHSSFIKGAVYKEEEEVLRLEMGNSFYYFYGVTKQKVARFKKSASKGSYFCKFIKGQYVSKKRKK